jgi:hypothetical protein
MKCLKNSKVAIFSLLVLGATSASAAIVTSGLGSTGWSASYDNAQVSGFGLSGSTLSLNLSLTTQNPVTISFRDNSPAVTDPFGLRITLNETVTNNSGVAFGEFQFSLNDGSPRAPEDTNTHPGIAHFHNDGTSLGSFTIDNNIGTTSSRLPLPPLPPEFRSPNFFTASGSILASGASTTWRGIGIHEYELVGQTRSFDLIQYPFPPSTGPGSVSVPEPSSYALLVVGLLGLGMTMRRRSA